MVVFNVHTYVADHVRSVDGENLLERAGMDFGQSIRGIAINYKDSGGQKCRVEEVFVVCVEGHATSVQHVNYGFAVCQRWIEDDGKNE